MAVMTLVDQVPLPIVADVSISRHGNSLLMIWRIEDETARLASLLQHAQRLGRIGGFEENLETGEITWSSELFTLYGRPAATGPESLRSLAAHAHPDDGVARHIRIVAEPVLDSGDRLLAVRGAYQDISSQHWTEVALAATRDQLAHSEQEVAERNRLTLQLQHAIMPPARGPLEAPGLQIAVRYRPAETEALVGGDWYDSFVLPSRLVLLCVGDIAGHGDGGAAQRTPRTGHDRRQPRATAVLAQQRRLPPHRPGDRYRRVRTLRPGHPPPALGQGRTSAPVVLSANEAKTLPLTRGVLLGALAESAYEESEIQLQPGDTLLMYTDGLVERRDTNMHDSLTYLLTNAQAPVNTLNQLMDHLLTYSKSDTDDDTCLIGVRVLAEEIDHVMP
jgi:hypothetical protein